MTLQPRTNPAIRPRRTHSITQVACFCALLLLVLTGSVSAFAQSGTTFEAHVVGGAIATNIPGIDTTVNVFGVRAVYMSDFGAAELGFLTGRGSEGISYQSIPLNMRMDIPIADVTAFALLGGHVDAYRLSESEGGGEKRGFGWQMGGGLMLNMSEAAAIRGDFELRFSPGRSLFAGVALVFRF